MKKKILVFCDFYLPGLKSGGGMWTVVHLVDNFAEIYDFYVVTRNYESKGDKQPYSSVRSGSWNTVGNAEVFYLANDNFDLKTFVSITEEIRPDAVFLNSAFSLPVIRFLTARQKKLVAPVPVVLAPCGELSANARSVKPLKKKMFLYYAKMIGLYNDLIWKASSQHEMKDILAVMGTGSEVHIAPDLLPRSILPEFNFSSKPTKIPGNAKFIFLSRIVKVKNLFYLLERLRELREGEISLEIVGPVEDKEYWDRCRSLIDQLPRNIKVVQHPSFVTQAEGLSKMQENHFFVLPTLTENFGYVLVEALSAGCPLLISDNTPWNQLRKRDAGWEISLGDADHWKEIIGRCVEMDQETYERMSLSARTYASSWLENEEPKTLTARILELAMGRRISSPSAAINEKLEH